MLRSRRSARDQRPSCLVVLTTEFTTHVLVRVIDSHAAAAAIAADANSAAATAAAAAAAGAAHEIVLRVHDEEAPPREAQAGPAGCPADAGMGGAAPGGVVYTAGHSTRSLF